MHVGAKCCMSGSDVRQFSETLATADVALISINLLINYPLSVLYFRFVVNLCQLLWREKCPFCRSGVEKFGYHAGW